MTLKSRLTLRMTAEVLAAALILFILVAELGPRLIDAHTDLGLILAVLSYGVALVVLVLAANRLRGHLRRRRQILLTER